MITARPFLGQVRLAGSVPAKKLGAGATPLTDSGFSQVLSAPMAIVDFWSPECPYCVEFKPIFESVAAGTPSVLMATVNTDENTEKAGEYKVQALPTVIFFKNGKEVHRMEGGSDEAGFKAAIAQAFSGVTPGSAPAGSSSGILSGIALAGILGGVVYLIATRS
jgi:thioredoxin-like negative regulator of GroEL